MLKYCSEIDHSDEFCIEHHQHLLANKLTAS
ncbi:Conserved hypothetical protein [Prochlorococcus marinus str. MIT 9303]|uniref:Uncharacterized protein n=1 Tax=Prochlorococcus marinus (strain MIT 9303) TaxID=59922 RepID=A2C888_PROM3|nr:Conserved hypothetical protein [Prochlorococcus marinus str. MIT 9303]